MGDLLVDRTYKIRRVRRPTSLSAGEFFRKESVQVSLGGAPTLARVLRCFGETTLVVPAATRGELADFVSDTLEGESKLERLRIEAIPCHRWPVAEVTRFIENDFKGQPHLLYRVEEQPDAPLDKTDLELLARTLRQSSYNVVVVSDYGRGFVSPEVCELLSEVDAPVILDPSDSWQHYFTIPSIHTIISRRDQIESLLVNFGVTQPQARSSVDEVRAAKFVLSTMSGVGNLVLKDYGDSDASIYSRSISGNKIKRDTFRKSQHGLSTRLGGGTAFTAYYAVGISIGLDVTDAALLAQSGALAMSLIAENRLPLPDDLTVNSQQIDGLISRVDSNSFELAETMSEEPPTDILLHVTTDVERAAVIAALLKAQWRQVAPQVTPTFSALRFESTSGRRVALTHSDMGSGGPGGSFAVVSTALSALRPRFAILTGIAFGFESEVNIGEIIVATHVVPYELQRLGTSKYGTAEIRHRGTPLAVRPQVIEGLRVILDGLSTESRVLFGQILSGEKLIDNRAFRSQLHEAFPGAKGGEMEGYGFAAACVRHDIDWFFVKAVCDFADGEKSFDGQSRQSKAAAAASEFCVRVIPSLLKAVRPPTSLG
ncbi:hypothetical protein [Streptomyces sp. bgisy027]|uniref:phosphorylase family protein n=1 Tax=Streptomyces sp. bgisy027 TaxID=3413770 RepID=UPI003D75E841